MLLSFVLDKIEVLEGVHNKFTVFRDVALFTSLPLSWALNVGYTYRDRIVYFVTVNFVRKLCVCLLTMTESIYFQPVWPFPHFPHMICYICKWHISVKSALKYLTENCCAFVPCDCYCSVFFRIWIGWGWWLNITYFSFTKVSIFFTTSEKLTIQIIFLPKF